MTKINTTQKQGEEGVNNFLFLTGKKEKYNLIQNKIIKGIFKNEKNI
jgi:hypothetical protein